MFKRIDHIEIVPSDFDRSLEFYTDILGFGLRERIPIVGHPPLQEVAYIDLADTTIELLRYDNPRPASVEGPQVGYRMMALEVDSMESTVEYLAGKGIRPSTPPFDAGGSLRAEITDPDGLPIELRQW
ncbi:MAG: VOC family protein [Actinobacteria bacterium]|nr:VOC family protein [Actinomycetota bacterium]